MPYKVKKQGDQYVVYKKDTGKRVGATAGNKEALRKYLAALHLNANESMIKLTDILREAKTKCPAATQDISLNLKNRQKAIDEYGYGPLNPNEPNEKFWQKKVDEWDLDNAEEAKKSRCGNCAAFDQTKKTLGCIAQGIGTDQGSENPMDVIEAGDLGYCRFLKFKCAAKRTCDAWVVGGPLKDKEE